MAIINSTDEQEPIKVSEAEATYQVARHTYGCPTPTLPQREEAMPDDCISSEDFWRLFEHKMRAAYAEL